MALSYASEALMTFEGNVIPSEITVRFNLVELLAQNEFGETYLLSEKGENKLFVLKSLQRFELLSEIEVLKGLEHKGLPKFETQIEDNRTIYTLREYIPGSTLEEYVTENILSDDDAVHIILELCDILELLHSQPTPIIHRDLKPTNIIINTYNRTVTLIDFGVSRIYNEEADRDTICVATRGFAAPEQFGFAQTDIRTDIYAVGVLLRYVLTGNFIHNKMIMNSVLNQTILKCTALDPKDRFQNISELRRYLKRYKANAAQKTKRVIISVIAACILFAAGFAFAGYFGNSGEPEPGRPIIVNLGGVSDPSSIDALSITAADPVLTGSSNEAYTFIEPLIEEAARLVLNKSNDDPVTIGELESIRDIFIIGESAWKYHDEWLSISQHRNGSLKSLEDVRVMKNLRSIRLEFQPLSDLSPLVECQNLESIYLQHCNVSDISILAKLPVLREVALMETLVTDFSILKDIKMLSSLTLSPLNDLSILQGIDYLILLNIPLSKAINKISDLGELVNNLRFLSVHGTRIDTLEGLENTVWLDYLDLSQTQITDFSLLNDKNIAPRLKSIEISRDMVQYLHTLDREGVDIVLRP